MIARKINQALNLNANHILYYHLGNWFHVLNRFPGILADKNGYVRLETLEEYLNNPYLTHGERLHVRLGISNIPTYVEFTEEQKYIINQFTSEAIDTNIQAERRPRNIDSIVRNQTLVRLVKRLRDNTCQICNLKLQIGSNSFYSEVHHIRPLGTPHDGPDLITNMICVCPNCHIKLDYGFELISYAAILNIHRHTISEVYVRYHNERV